MVCAAGQKAFCQGARVDQAVRKMMEQKKLKTKLDYQNPQWWLDTSADHVESYAGRHIIFMHSCGELMVCE